MRLLCSTIRTCRKSGMPNHHLPTWPLQMVLFFSTSIRNCVCQIFGSCSLVVGCQTILMKLTYRRQQMVIKWRVSMMCVKCGIYVQLLCHSCVYFCSTLSRSFVSFFTLSSFCQLGDYGMLLKHLVPADCSNQISSRAIFPLLLGIFGLRYDSGCETCIVTLVTVLFYRWRESADAWSHKNCIVGCVPSLAEQQSN